MVLVTLSRLFERFMGHQPDTSPDHPTNHCYAYVNVVNSIAKHDAPLHRYICILYSDRRHHMRAYIYMGPSNNEAISCPSQFKRAARRKNYFINVLL